MIGRRYKVEKKEEGNKTGLPRDKLAQNGQVSESKSTREKIAAQLKVGTGTVSRATELTEAIDTITALCYN